MGVCKSFGTNITEKPPWQICPHCLWSAWDQIGLTVQYLAKNASFGPNLGQKSIFGGEWGKLFGILISKNQ